MENVHFLLFFFPSNFAYRVLLVFQQQVGELLLLKYKRKYFFCLVNIYKTNLICHIYVHMYVCMCV